MIGEDRLYWGYLSDCLEASSAVIRTVQAMPENKTSLGKGRAFIRYNLKTKTLAEHMQVACRYSKLSFICSANHPLNTLH